MKITNDSLAEGLSNILDFWKNLENEELEVLEDFKDQLSKNINSLHQNLEQFGLLKEFDHTEVNEIEKHKQINDFMRKHDAEIILENHEFILSGFKSNADLNQKQTAQLLKKEK